jgi:CheY-like chemotaxis protein
MKEVTIAIVDDAFFYATTFASVFERHGFTTLHFIDPAHILEHVTEYTMPDVFLIDIDMGDLDGFAVVRALQSQPAARKAVYVLISETGNLAERQAAEDMGVHAVVHKMQHTPNDIVHVVHKLLRSPTRFTDTLTA